MESNLVSIHKFLSYLVLIIIPFAAIIAYINWKKQRPYLKIHEILARVNIGFIHLQMMLGIILMTHSAKVSYSMLDNHLILFWSLIHPAIMFISIILVTLALMLVRNKKSDIAKHRQTFIFNGLAFVFIVIALVIKSNLNY